MKRLITAGSILVIVAATFTVLTGCSTPGSVGTTNTSEPLIFSAVAPELPTKYPGVFLCKTGDIVWATRILDKNPQAVNARDADGNTPLMRWIEGFSGCGGPDFGEFLVDRGADVNAHSNDGRTALMIAANYHLLNIINFLIAKGAKVNLRDKDGETALTWAQVQCQRLAGAAASSSLRFQFSNECNECAIAIGRAGGTR
jgi:Ankyrin repeats (3 copies)